MRRKADPNVAAHADKTVDNLPVTSSVPVELPEEQEALAREVLIALGERGIPHAVAGAFALLQHTAICRTTKDLDLFLTTETGALPSDTCKSLDSDVRS